MNKKISANEFRETLDSLASDLKANPWLAQGIIASEMKGEPRMKRKWTTSLVIALLIILTLGTAAYGVSTLWRTVNWQGEVVGTGEQKYITMPEEKEELYNKVRAYTDSVPEEEMGAAWVEDGDELNLWNSGRKPIEKTFRSAKEFLEYMSGVTTLTAPVWLPEGEEDGFLATVYLVSKDTGKYEVVEEGEDGPLHYVRFRVDEADLLPVEYMADVSMADGTCYMIHSLLKEERKDATYLDEGESVEKVMVSGMDEALVIRGRQDPAEHDMIMHRKLAEPAGWKLIGGKKPYTERTGYYSDEYVQVWGPEGAGPADLVKLFNGE